MTTGRFVRLPRRRLAVRGPVLALAASAAVTLLGVASGSCAQEPEHWRDEATRLVQALGVEPGATVAEIGAGRGELTVEMAGRLGPTGRVFSTEIDARRLEDIRSAVRRAALQNVTVVESAERASNLPEGCCDAIYMREVYHHFQDPERMVASLRAALVPGGRLAVIDYPERDARGGDCHCIEKDRLVQQVTAWGFEAVADQDGWAGSRYLAVFRKR